MAAGCTSDEWPPLPEDEDAAGTDTHSEPGESTGAAAQGVFLRVFEPMSASLHRIGEPIPLIAEIQDQAGLPTDFDDVVWFSDTVDYALHDGAMGEVVLPPGTHQITAFAELQNGDRLTTTVGDVRVQSGFTGIWSGDLDLVLTVNFMGFPLAPRCSGPLDFTMDIEGRIFTAEDGACVLDVLIAQLDVTYNLDATRNGHHLEGTIMFSFAGFASVEMPWAGRFEERELNGTFAGMLSIPLVGEAMAGGSLRAFQTTPYLDPP
jgi:hypothetical protein